MTLLSIRNSATDNIILMGLPPDMLQKNYNHTSAQERFYFLSEWLSALISIVMKLVTSHISMNIPASLNPLQFDAISLALHTALEPLEKNNSYVRTVSEQIHLQMGAGLPD